MIAASTASILNVQNTIVIVIAFLVEGLCSHALGLRVKSGALIFIIFSSLYYNCPSLAIVIM